MSKPKGGVRSTQGGLKPTPVRRIPNVGAGRGVGTPHSQAKGLSRHKNPAIGRVVKK